MAPIKQAWWRYSMVWLVVSGPLAVIVGCLVTAIYIAHYPDPPVRIDQTGITAVNDDVVVEHVRSESMLPALKARNQAAQISTRAQPELSSTSVKQ